ncbi:hypothetical protein [Oscillatoria sp. FACHB-1406]|uniref:hypothetical protein n=1 Tax=Oscillatoria sp. FACHB-1406 TaxID=2692846 RepID=UPI0016893C7E|nr:hypothetical protein [Oscillatoria sp. FACHB-1406]MBD2580082.1 hypothetical protein [Oscillatoria sp. FACHB-1406]
MNSITRLNAKVIGIWAGLGAILGVLIAISALSSGSVQFGDALSIFLQGSLVFLVNGFFYYALDGVFRYKFRFDQIFYPLWVWAIYPVLGALVLGFSIAIGMLGTILQAAFGVKISTPKLLKTQQAKERINKVIENNETNLSVSEVDEICEALSGGMSSVSDKTLLKNILMKLVSSPGKKVKDVLSSAEIDFLLNLFLDET